ncbi:MAG: lytic transglycosylase domain-containing protein [Ferruginibacter sp.]
MKTSFSRSLAALLLLVGYTNKDFAQDTLCYPLFNCSDVKEQNVMVIREANVQFPEILTGNEKQSIDYIEKFSSTRKAYLVRTYNRSKELFPKAAEILKKHDVPQEFKVLLALESSFNPNAVSSAGAVGYWQIMDNVAREYGLKISHSKNGFKKRSKAGRKGRKTISVDERKNFDRSTHVAAQYLKDRSRNLNNDWLLIAASYNWGVGNIWKAMEKTGKSNPTFWDIQQYLPTETKAYVMNFITLNVIFHNYKNFFENKLCFKAITKTTDPLAEELALKNTSFIY